MATHRRRIPRAASAPPVPPVRPTSGCTIYTPRCGDARDYNVELRDCCRGHVINVTKATAEALTALKIPFCADYGTLLGGVRNPLTTWADYPWLRQEGRTTTGPAAGIIPHDKDSDLLLFYTDWTKALAIVPILTKKGFRVEPNVRRHSMKVRLSQANHTNCDLFFWREKAGGIMYRNRYAQVDKHKGKEFPRSMLQPFSTVEWEGLKLPAPNNPERFLEMRYPGTPDWRTPIPQNNNGQKA